MNVERTFSMIKPDAIIRRLSGAINNMIENAGFSIIAQKMIKLTLEQAQKFYSVHCGQPFYNELCLFISSRPVIVQVLVKENAIEDYRKLMGDTNPEKAKDWTIRKRYGISIGQNSVHGSDSVETANIEISFFFKDDEIVGSYIPCDS